MTLYFDKLIDRYIPTDSGWNFHPDNTALLSSTEIDSKLVVEATNPLPKDYKQLMYSNVSGEGNATVYYLDMITSKDSGTLPTIERDLAASNAKAIKLAPNTTMIFRTNYPYNKDRLKKVLCRCRKAAADTELTLHVGVIGIEDKAYKQPDGTYGNTSFYEVAVSGEVTDSYVTYVGYILDTDSVEGIETALLSHPRPNNDPDYPAKLLDGTTDIALMIKTGAGGAGENEFIYVDSIELQDTENALTELPQGALVINTIEGMSDDNRLTPVEKSYLVTLMSEIDAEYGDKDGTPVLGIYYAGHLAGVNSTNLLSLETAYDNLKAAYTDWTADMYGISTIDGANFNLLFSTYFTNKTAVQQETANLVTARISLSVDHSSVSYNGYGVLKYDDIIITAYPVIIENDDLVFKRSDEETDETGLFTTDALGNPLPSNKRRLACSSVSDDGVVITASAVLGTRTHSSSVTIMVVRDQLAGGANLGGRSVVPTPITEGRPLMVGDYFLCTSNTMTGYTKGEIYEWDGDSWETSSDGNKVMTLFDDFARLANDVDSMVIGNAVIKNLVAINAFIQNLNAENITVGAGNGTTGGFRFRAKSRADLSLPYNAATNPSVFDIYQDDKQLFKVNITTGEVEMGNYTSGKGTLYTPSTGEFKGKFSEVRNVLPYQYEDSLDASHPFEIDFYIPSETVNIVSIKLNAKGLKYRAYSSAVGYSNPWSDDYYTDSATPSMSLTMPFGNNEETSGGGSSHTHSYDKASSSTGASGSHAHSVGSQWSTTSTGASSSFGDYHTHDYNPAVETSGSSGNHSHSISSSSATTGSATATHSHKYKIPTGISGGAHSHKVTVNLDHTHAVSFGIYEGTIPASVYLYCDNGAGYGSAISLGSGAILANELDLTLHFTGTGWKKLKFTSTQLGRIIANLILQVDITV